MTNGANVETTDYISGIHYVDGQISFIQTATGRMVYNGSTFDYEYNLTDHLGNVRVVFNDQGIVEQTNDYYPFGLIFNSYTSGDENLYKFTGKEDQKETGWIDFGARMFDPALGRWQVIDNKGAALQTYTNNGQNCFSAATAQLADQGVTQTEPNNAIHTKVDANSTLTADAVGGSILIQTQLNDGGDGYGWSGRD